MIRSHQVFSITLNDDVVICDSSVDENENDSGVRRSALTSDRDFSAFPKLASGHLQLIKDSHSMR